MRRREFLRHSAVAAALSSPAGLAAFAHRAAGCSGEPELWEVVRAAYSIPADRVYLNVATLGPQPRPVVDAVLEHTRRVAMTYPPSSIAEELRSEIGGFLNGEPEGFVFTRNATEAMNFVAHGLDLAAGDEVVTTLHEHIGGLCCWQLLAARRGISLRQIALPPPGASPAELLGVIADAISPRTRVVSISHVTFTNGAVLPVREIAALCRRQAIICVVDGAHPPGMMRVDLAAIDADFYASSTHKWLCAPQGTGLLYIRDQWRSRIWPTIASGGWDDAALGAHRLNHVGTVDESRLAGLLAAVRFQKIIGVDRVSSRIEELRQALLRHLVEVPRLHVRSPRTLPAAAGMVSFDVEGADSLDLQRQLAEANVRIRVVSEYDYGWMRVSPHIFTSLHDVERFVEVLSGVI
jgi:isopenicillin-N epimerase